MKKIISVYQKKIALRLRGISLSWDRCHQLKHSINYTLLNCGKLIRSVIILLGLDDLKMDSNQLYRCCLCNRNDSIIYFDS